MYQKIIFDNKTGYPKEVCIYKNDDTLVTHFKVDSIDTSVSFKYKPLPLVVFIPRSPTKLTL